VLKNEEALRRPVVRDQSAVSVGSDCALGSRLAAPTADRAASGFVWNRGAIKQLIIEKIGK
jgi:hypothetical protein